MLELARRYAAAAMALGRDDLAEVLQRVPAHPAASFHEALQALRLCHAVLWLSGHYHCGLGRLDQYLWPYLEADLAEGRLVPAQAQELLEEFFISLNKDSDLYPGIQQGDNGQSLMLGGVRRDGGDGVNPLTAMVLEAGRKVALIDPKINLRVTRDTDLGLLAKGVELTRIGLGFPQWCNDEVVIPGLVGRRLRPGGRPGLYRGGLLGVHHSRQGHGGGEHRRRLHAGRGGPGDSRRARGRGGFRPDPGARRRRSGRAGARPGRGQPKAAAAAGALVLGADGRLPRTRPGPLATASSTTTSASTAPARPTPPTPSRRCAPWSTTSGESIRPV